MASGSYEENAIVISDDEDESTEGHHVRPDHTQHAVAASARILNHKDWPKANLSFAEGRDRAVPTFHQPSVDSPISRLHPHDTSARRLNTPESDIQDFRRDREAPFQQREALCPYYYEPKFELKMYRGPGFGKFHPVLGSMAGHKEICEEWDARQFRMKNSQTHIAFRPLDIGSKEGSGSTDIGIDRSVGTPFNSGRSLLQLDREKEQHCLEQVLEVFPMVQHNFVRKLFRERHPGHTGSLADSQAADTHVPGAIIAEIAEMECFPKERDLKRKHSPTSPESQDKTIKWNKDILKNETYYKEALILLADEFIRVPTHFIHKTLREIGTLYDTFHILADNETSYNNTPRKPYTRSKLGRMALEKKYQRNASEKREGHQYVSIVNEFQAARQQQHREETRQKRQKADEEAEADNFTLHKLQGSLVECQCCFDEAPINRVVNCENDRTHFFCQRCIEMRAKEQIGAIKHQMACMDTSGCGAELSKEALARALPVKISDKLAEIQQLAEIKAAGLDGLEQCPFCEFQAVCAPADVDTLFECLNPDCEKISCRKCREGDHLPRSCEEAKKDRGLSARHAVEEARSEAMMRSCPRCKVKIIKSVGCNKMTCSNCRAVMCYVCKKDITGKNYEHFGSGATACPISDRSSEDRHQQEADEAEKAAIATAKARDSDVNEEDLRMQAHLNQIPTQESDNVRLQDVYRPPAGLHLPVVPNIPDMDGVYNRLPFGRERDGPRIGHDAPPVDLFHDALLQEARQHRDRMRMMLQDHQQQVARLRQFLPAPGVPPVRLPGLLHHGLVPPARHTHQTLQNISPRPAADAARAPTIRNIFDAEAGEALASRMHNMLERDLLRPARGYVRQTDPFSRHRGVFQAERPPATLNEDIFYPPLLRRVRNNLSNPGDNGVAQARQQQNQA